MAIDQCLCDRCYSHILWNESTCEVTIVTDGKSHGLLWLMLLPQWLMELPLFG